MSWVFDEEAQEEFCDHNCDTFIDDNEMIRCADCDTILGSVLSNETEG